MSPARLVMLGPPGAGKGTQADRFARERGVPRVSTGDIIREAVMAGTELGRAAGALIDAGHFVSDEIAIGIVRERLAGSDAARGWVLDGFPRTLPQATALDGLIEGRRRFVVVDIEVPEDTLVHRLALRRVCSRCGATAEPGAVRCARCGGELVQRADDDREVVRERLRVYARETRPIVEFYRGRSTFRTVNGDQPPDVVAAEIAAAVAAAEGGRA
jgi:adenylate kinase